MIEAVSIAISALAFAVSIFSFGYQYARGKNEFFLQVYEKFLSEEQQRGRRRLYEARDNNENAFDLTAEDLLPIDNALGYLDIIGYLYRTRQIPKQETLELIGGSAARTAQAAREIDFFKLRDELHGFQTWPNWRQLAADSEAALSKRVQA